MGKSPAMNSMNLWRVIVNDIGEEDAERTWRWVRDTMQWPGHYKEVLEEAVDLFNTPPEHGDDSSSSKSD